MTESSADTSDPWDEFAAGWDDQPEAHRYAEAAFDQLCSVALQAGLDLDGIEICDFGCGTGLLTERLVDTVGAIDAVDTSPQMRFQIRKKMQARGWTSVRVASEIPTSHASHDLVVCSSVLGFVDDLGATVRELAQLLRLGGLLVHWDWERTEADDDHGLTRTEIRSALESSDLEVLTIEPAFAVTIEGVTMQPLMGVARRIVWTS